MPDLMIDVAGHRLEVVRTERFLFQRIGEDRRGGIAGSIYRAGRRGWGVEVALGSFALFIQYTGNSFRAEAA